MKINDIITEGTASGDSSLHDWFTKSKSSDGTPGWVQIGGKYAGKPCAKQPGQKTKPKCGSSKMKRDLSAKEEESAARRKRQADPNPNRKGKAKNVNTKPKNESQELDEACWPGYHKEGMKTMFGKQYPDCRKNKKVKEGAPELLKAEMPLVRQIEQNLAKHGYEKGTEEYNKVFAHMMSFFRKFGNAERINQPDIKEEKCPHCAGPMFSEMMINEKKDACYYKVKSRYSVWPSAYASGALVKCRKAGAKNWGNKSKK